MKLPATYLHDFFSKVILTTISLMFLALISIAQSGAKWTTAGNGIGTGDYFGSTTNFPIIFKVNNAQKMMLSTSGILQLNNLSGTSTRFLQTDASGNIIPFAMGTSSQVLYGNGTWGSLPSFPAVLWNTSGSNIHYSSGRVGIGTSTPTVALDVIGDARISNNLYVGGGIIITDRVNANAEVITAIVKTDSIVTDSTKGFYGTTKFNGDVKLKNKLSVDGDAVISGTLSTANLSLSNSLSTYRITTLAGDSLIRFGDSTLYFNPGLNQITNSTTSAIKGLGLGNGSVARGLHSFTIGRNARTTNAASNSVVIGGCDIGISMNLNCSEPNRLWVGFNSNVPTFVVTPANGSAGSVGRVGIGTSNPEDLLQIGNQFTKVNIGPATGLEIGYGTSYIGFNAVHQNATGSAPGTWSTANDFANNGGSIIYSTIFGDMLFSTIPTTGSSNQTGITDATIFDNTKLLINRDGNIGIGVNNIPDPNYKLTVCGAIHSKRVVVSLGWCDFVFANDYKLRTLEETEKYIKINGHLPEIPSAKEVETNGGDLGELVRLQMQKIEELTLYLIEQNKKIEVLEKQVNSKH